MKRTKFNCGSLRWNLEKNMNFELSFLIEKIDELDLIIKIQKAFWLSYNRDIDLKPPFGNLRNRPVVIKL